MTTANRTEANQIEFVLGVLFSSCFVGVWSLVWIRGRLEWCILLLLLCLGGFRPTHVQNAFNLYPTCYAFGFFSLSYILYPVPQSLSWTNSVPRLMSGKRQASKPFMGYLPYLIRSSPNSTSRCCFYFSFLFAPTPICSFNAHLQEFGFAIINNLHESPLT